MVRAGVAPGRAAFGTAAILVAAFVHAGPAFAQFADVESVTAPAPPTTMGRYRPPPRGESETYIVTLNANAVLRPTFPGSENLSASFFPSLNYRRSDEPERFSAPDDGISISLFDTPSFRVGPVFRYQAGRYLDDDRSLFGLRKRGYDVEGGGFIEYWPLTFIRARAEVRHGFRDDSGLVANFGVDAVQPFGNFVFSLGPRLTVGDRRYHDRYFGVRPSEAAISGIVTPYRPGGGLTSVGAVGAVTYKWSQTWATTAYVGYDRLVDDVANSPIVTRIGSKDQFTFGGKLSYSFAYTPNW